MIQAILLAVCACTCTTSYAPMQLIVCMYTNRRAGKKEELIGFRGVLVLLGPTPAATKERASKAICCASCKLNVFFSQCISRSNSTDDQRSWIRGVSLFLLAPPRDQVSMSFSELLKRLVGAFWCWKNLSISRE